MVDSILETMNHLADSSLEKVRRLSLELIFTSFTQQNGPNIFSAFCSIVVPRLSWDLRALSITGKYLFCANGGSAKFRRLFARFPNLEEFEFECSCISDPTGLAKAVVDEAKSLKLLTIRCPSMDRSEEQAVWDEAFRVWMETTGGRLKMGY